MFGRSKTKTTTPLSAALAEQLDEREPPNVEDAVIDALDAIGPALTKLYEDAYARAVSDVLATLQERIDEIEYRVANDVDARLAGLPLGLKDAIVTVEAMN